MFSCVLISADSTRASYMRMLAASTGQLTIVREYTQLPGNYEFSRVLHAVIPDIVAVDLDIGPEVLDVCSRVREFSPRTAVIGLAGAFTPTLPASVRNQAFNSLVSHNCETDEFMNAVKDALHASTGGTEKNLYCILPCKAGSGASTLTLNIAAALARFKKRVLVVEADLRSGILGIMAGAPAGPSLQGALANSAELDNFVWQRQAVHLHGVDFLLSSRSLDAQPPDWVDYFQLLNFCRDRYDAILVDMPELINPATVELARRAVAIYPVCTPEIPSLKLALQRAEELRRWHVEHDRIKVIVNRVHDSDPDAKRIAAMLELEVANSFPNDYPLVYASIAEAVPVPSDSKLGRAFDAFAASLVGETYVPPKASFAGRMRGLFA